jgi:hypothetical protein
MSEYSEYGTIPDRFDGLQELRIIHDLSCAIRQSKCYDIACGGVANQGNTAGATTEDVSDIVCDTERIW